MKLILIAVLVFTLGIVGISVASYFSAYNTSVTYEATIDKFDKSSQNTLSAYTLKIKEMVQVPEMYVEDLKSVVSATFEGRYGSDGSRAVMQWIQEQNLQFDSSLYLNLQAAMAAGREEFKLSQDKKLDVCKDYEMYLGYAWSGFWTKMAGYPKKDIDKLCRIVLDTQTSNTFETGIAEPISLK